MEAMTWSDLDMSNASFIVEDSQMTKFVNLVGNEVSEDGFVVDKEGRRVTSQDEDEIKLKQIGSLSSGSKNFIKKNIASYSEFLAEKRC